jgi:hypothetical protein
MKKIILVVLIGFTTLTSFGQIIQQKSELNLSVYNNIEFTMIFDAVVYSKPSNTYRVENINPGSHSLQLFKVEKYRTYDGYWDQKFVLLFSAMVTIPENSRITALIDQSNQFVTVSSDRIIDMNRRDGNGDRDRDHDRDRDGDRNRRGPKCMTDNQFNELKNSVSSKPFEETKLSVAKEAIAANGTKTSQVIELMELMSFEGSKLTLAKYAYSYTVDKNEYYLVNDAFTFSSSIDDLSQYIQNQPK